MFYCIATSLKDASLVWWNRDLRPVPWTTDPGRAAVFEILPQAVMAAGKASASGDSVYVYAVRSADDSTLVDGYRNGLQLRKFATKQFEARRRAR